jgi:hypothetical protein
MIRLYLTLTALTGYLTDATTRLRDEEDGLTTTEIAVVTFLLVGAAIVVMGIIYVAARNNADNIPVPEAPA